MSYCPECQEELEKDGPNWQCNYCCQEFPPKQCGKCQSTNTEPFSGTEYWCSDCGDSGPTRHKCDECEATVYDDDAEDLGWHEEESSRGDVFTQCPTHRLKWLKQALAAQKKMMAKGKTSVQISSRGG